MIHMLILLSKHRRQELVTMVTVMVMARLMVMARPMVVMVAVLLMAMVMNLLRSPLLTPSMMSQ